MPIAPSESDWKELIELNPDYRNVKNKSFPQYEDMDYLCGKNTAKGRWCFGSTDADFEGQSSSDDDDVQVIGHGRRTNDVGAEVSPGCDPGSMEYVVETQDFSTDQVKSSSGQKRRCNTTSSNVSRRKFNDKIVDMHRERIEVCERLLQNRSKNVEKEEIEECLKKINSLDGITSDFRVSSVGLLKSKENRAIIQLLDEVDLKKWLIHEQQLQNRSLFNSMSPEQFPLSQNPYEMSFTENPTAQHFGPFHSQPYAPTHPQQPSPCRPRTYFPDLNL